MPKYKIRRPGDDTRLSKGRCAFDISFDISEQCDDVKKGFTVDEGGAPQTEDCLKSQPIDTRTFNEIMIDAFQRFNNSSKSSQTRSNALETICIQLSLSHNPNFLTGHKETILNCIQMALQNENPSEVEWAARLISLTAIQLPHSDRSFQGFDETLMAVLKNSNFKFSVRSAVCHAIGILTFLNAENDFAIYAVMEEIKYIFLPVPYHTTFNHNHTNDLQIANLEFQIAALDTWIFLATLLTSNFTFLSGQSVGNIHILLDCFDFSMRLTCAKAIAVIFECGLYDSKMKSSLPKIIRNISNLRQNRNHRRHDFKIASEVFHYIQKGITPRREIRLGKAVLDLNTWALNIQYDMLCKVVGSGNITKHLSKNEELLTKIRLVNSTRRSLSNACLQEIGADYDSVNRYTFYSSPPTCPAQYDCEELSNNFMNATHESSLVRTRAFEDICKELQQNHVPLNFLTERISVILDIVVRTMKRGNETEQISAIRLATLIVIQLGYDERFCSKLSNIFCNLLQLPVTAPLVNSSICTALAFFNLVDTEYTSNVLEIMDLLSETFYESEPNSRKSNEYASNEELNLLRSKALEAWGLLLTMLPPKDVYSFVGSRTIADLMDMLHTPNVEFRIACGQVISLIIEKGRMYDTSYLQSYIPNMCDVIKDIVVNDRCRNFSKDKRRSQSLKFREILKYLEDGSHVSFHVRFAEEVHELKTWSSVFKYQKLCEFIGPGLTTHLLQNKLLREIIPLGPEPIIERFAFKPIKQYTLRRLSSAPKKKLQTKENRLNSRIPKFGCV